MRGEIELKRKRDCAPVRNSSLRCCISGGSKSNGDGRQDSQGYGYNAITILVVLPKDISHALETDTCLDKEIETQTHCPAFIVAPATYVPRKGGEKQLYELGAQSIAELFKGTAEFREVDTATPVEVEAVEEGSPFCQETPETAKLIEIDCAAAVCVEHADHHLNGMGVESGVIAVNEGTAERGFRELASAVGVDSTEEGPEGVSIICSVGRRCDV